MSHFLKSKLASAFLLVCKVNALVSAVVNAGAELFPLARGEEGRGNLDHS